MARRVKPLLLCSAVLLLGMAMTWSCPSLAPPHSTSRGAFATPNTVATSAVAAVAFGSGVALRRTSLAMGAPLLRASLAAAGAAVAVLAAGARKAPRVTLAAAAPMGCIEEGATDPSLFVQTNVKLGDKKMAFMQAASKAVAKCLGKPESYVAVSVQDGQDIIWGGSDAPCALCKVISLGSINLENNKALTFAVSNLLAEFDVPPNRIYVNFFDLERQNVGYNGATFAG
eukprot:TRINITY_DN107886_c0_g1_i1.p1 TRINITY_DN107886_c0_g1~~TRINITY_DN107886_c0_g1_i1.p1  ORF type:complete len:249 (-),score=41.75 TRINITY_DN107886_c0_g1_i1:166-852(-)